LFPNNLLKSQQLHIHNKYVDRKFITLTTNLKTKIDRNGDTMTGDLNMNDNKITSSYVAISDDDLINKLNIDSLPKAAGVQNFDLDSKLDISGGTMSGALNMGVNKITSSYVALEDIDLVNNKQLYDVVARRLDDSTKIIMNRSREIFTSHVDMVSNRITSSYVAISDDDLINKKYLKTLSTANSSGHIPDLAEDSASSGFIVSSSSNMPQRCFYGLETGMDCPH